MRLIVPLPTPPIIRNETDNNAHTVGVHMMDLNKDGSQDGTSTPANTEASTMLPAPAKKEASTFLPAPTKKDAGTIPPEPSEKEEGTIPPAPTKNVPHPIPPAPAKKQASIMLPPSAKGEAGMTTENASDCKQWGAQQSDRPATASNQGSSSDDNIKDKDAVSWLLR
jgi:hypothetical protein